MNGFFDNPLDMETAEKISHLNDQTLKTLFKKEIRGSFLIGMKYRVLSKIDPGFIASVFDFNFGPENMLIGKNNGAEYDICRHIVGCHKSNTIFMKKEERSAKERNEEYKEQLANQVVTRLSVRNYGSAFFRNKPLVDGEDFIYYSVPYELFVFCVRMNEILRSAKPSLPNWLSIFLVTRKSLAALSLVEDGFHDSAYPLCRSVIEMYVKLLLVKDDEELSQEMYRFAHFDLDKTCCSGQYSEEFNRLYDNRKGKAKTGKIDFLNYGFVDKIADYHSIVKYNPYSVGGITEYLRNKASDDNMSEKLDNLERFYKMCHGYTHGNVYIARFPLLHYFEISLILGFIVPDIYRMLCDECGFDYTVNGVNLLDDFERDFQLLKKQYAERSTENFELDN